MRNHALLTIVVPTKDRCVTALETLGEIARIDGADQVQVIVHDCGSDRSLLDALEARGLDGGFEYHHTGGPVSMTENWNRAMDHVRGEYVIYIGDDDACCPDILAVCGWAHENGFDAVKSKQYSRYCHPDYPVQELASTLRLEPFTGAVEVRETGRMLERLVATGDGYFDLPMVYYGLIRTSVLRRLHERSGRYFAGISPDIYSAFAVGCMIDRFAEIDYPLTIPGASGSANSGRLVAGTAHLHFAEFSDYEFSWLAPETWHFVGSNTDNLVHALEASGRTDLIERIHVTRVYARTIIAEPRRVLVHVRKYIRVLRRLKRNVPVGLLGLLLSAAAKAVLLAVKPTARPGGKLTANVDSLGKAIGLQRDWLIEHGVTPPLRSH